MKTRSRLTGLVGMAVALAACNGGSGGDATGGGDGSGGGTGGATGTGGGATGTGGGAGTGGGGGAGSTGTGGGGVTVDFTCPDDASAYVRISDASYQLPGNLGTAYARIESILVQGDRVFYTSVDAEGRHIRRIAFDGTQDTEFFRDPDFTPVSHLTAGRGATHWWDGTFEPGRIVGLPNDQSGPVVEFTDVLMGPLARTEQYFDPAGNHFILANVRPEGQPWRTQLLRRSAVDGSIDVLFSRDQPVSGGAATQTYAYLGNRFYVVGKPTAGSGDLAILSVADDAAPIDPASPPALTPVSDLYCHDLVAFGSEVMWCLGYRDVIEPYSSLWALRPVASTPGGPIDDLDEIEVIHVDDQPDEPGRGLFRGVWATDGATVYFTSQDIVDGNAGIVSTIYRAIEFSPGRYDVSTVACNLPEITDMTLTNGELFFATFENDVDELDKHGLFRLR